MGWTLGRVGTGGCLGLGLGVLPGSILVRSGCTGSLPRASASRSTASTRRSSLCRAQSTRLGTGTGGVAARAPRARRTCRCPVLVLVLALWGLGRRGWVSSERMGTRWRSTILWGGSSRVSPHRCRRGRMSICCSSERPPQPYPRPPASNR
ncbi:hypothetical protein C8R46DRAFT_1074720, partial [Mycena filopes]